MSPRDFWAMHPEEFWWTVEAKTPIKRYGSMTEHEVAEIYREAYGEPPGSDDDRPLP